MTSLGSAGFPGEVQAVVQRARHVSRVHFHPEIGSTNEEALKLARAGAPHGSLVLADRQTLGRGRQGRSWHSPPGVGLWMTWILRPAVELNRSFLVTATAAVAVSDAAARTAGVHSSIKWPNDVLVRGRKICGLLAEAGKSADGAGFIAIGIGLNVNQVEADFPEEVRPVATSLRLAGGHRLDRAAVLSVFLESFEALYDSIETDDGARVRKEWLSRAGLMGRRVAVARHGESFEARAVGLAEDGALIVELDDGRREELRAADVTRLRDASQEA